MCWVLGEAAGKEQEGGCMVVAPAALGVAGRRPADVGAHRWHPLAPVPPCRSNIFPIWALGEYRSKVLGQQ